MKRTGRAENVTIQGRPEGLVTWVTANTRVPNKRTKRRTVIFLNVVISVVMNVEL